MFPRIARFILALALATSAAATLSATRCADPPCTPDVLLYGSFNGSSANASTQHWIATNDAGSISRFIGGVFSGVVGTNGFAMAQTGLLQFPTLFGCRGLVVTSRSSSEYSGFRLSFGTGDFMAHESYSSPGYKANFTATASYDDQYIDLTDFSRGWLAPGQPPWPDCAHDTSVCPTFLQMQNVQRLRVWAEAVPAKFQLEIQSIRATSCYQPSEAQTETPNASNKTKCALKCAAEAVGVWGVCAASCVTSADKGKCVEERCEAAQLAFEVACTSGCGKKAEDAPLTEYSPPEPKESSCSDALPSWHSRCKVACAVGPVCRYHGSTCKC